MDALEFMDKLYRALLERGWTLPEIDAMDVFYYLQMLRRSADTAAETVYIDQVL